MYIARFSSLTFYSETMSVDRLSALPDSILCYILSFLEMKDAAKTCLLSKRWQFLWTELPRLLLEDDEMEDVRKFVTRVNRTLIICSRNNLDGFQVNFKHKYNPSFASDVNVWIGSAVKNKVKEFILLLPGDLKCHHLLPQMMYSNPSWTSLSLRGCIQLGPRGTIEWQSLTTLRIEHVDLNENTLEKIFSGCPVLSSLDLLLCSGFNQLDVNSRSLRRLALDDYEWDPNLKISAPYIHTLKINLISGYFLENIKSLVVADVCGEWEMDAFLQMRENIEHVFGSIRHVMILKLTCECIELLSLIPPDWLLPQSTRGCLELNANYGDLGIIGILRLLESSPKLETLVINIGGSSYQDDENSDQSSKDDLDCDLLHLKTVRFTHSGCPNFDTCSEPMLTLAQILLKRAIGLEKMVVSFPGFTAASSTSILYKMTQTLLSYPRSSQKAVILFN